MPDFYCQFRGEDCPAKNVQKPDLKIFCAYPSSPRIKGYMQQLCKNPQLIGTDMFLWEQLGSGGGTIFCKICKELLQSKAILADITILNQNVLFEIGYAIAKEKLPILIREQERETQTLDLLSDFTHIPYTDISALAGKIAMSVFESFPQDLRVEGTKEEPGLLFINADANLPIKRTIYKHLQDFCSAIAYKIEIDDSSELFSHKLITLLNKVEKNRLIVCHMVGTDFRGSDQINAHVSFLAGFALGRHKRMLILQESPGDRMIDLQHVRKEYSDATTALMTLDNWLRPIKLNEESLCAKMRKTQEVVSLQEQLLSALGHPAAEYDTFLPNYFIQTPGYVDAVRCRRTLLLGRRGAGKTANFFQLFEAFSRQANNIVIRISPSKLQLLNTIDRLSEIVGETRVTALFEVFWQYLIITEIAIQCERYESEHPHRCEPFMFNELYKILKPDDISKLPFDARFNKLIDSLISQHTVDDKDALRANILTKFYKEVLPTTKSIITAISLQHPVRILVDNLDRDWNNGRVTTISYLINALLDVMDKINVRELLGDAKVIAFLRADIYKLSSKYDPDFDKRQAWSLQWDKSSLKQLICERISLVKRSRGQNNDDLWASVFGKTIDGIGDTFEYIVTRTMLRPRDLITFCTQILDEMTRKQTIEVSKDILLAAEREYSEYLLKNLRQEFSVGYPDVEDVCIALFVGKPRTILEAQLKRRISEDLPMNDNLSITDMIKFLFDAGILGIEANKTEFFGFGGCDYDRTRRNAELKGTIKYLIHPGLTSALSLSE